MTRCLCVNQRLKDEDQEQLFKDIDPVLNLHIELDEEYRPTGTPYEKEEYRPTGTPYEKEDTSAGVRGLNGDVYHINIAANDGVRIPSPMALISQGSVNGNMMMGHTDLTTLRTPLHWAAASGQAEALKTLLDLGVDPNPVDVDEGTPLDYARQSGHQECVRILEEKLGIRCTEYTTTTNDTNIHHPHQRTNPTQEHHTKRSTTKNPFGFIVDLFRPRQKGPPPTATKSDLDYRVDGEKDISGESLETNYGGPEEEEAMTSSSLPNSQLSTPVKRQRDSEVLRSMEMIHLSREDNPLVQKLRQSEMNLGLGGVHQSHGSMNILAGNNPIGGSSSGSVNGRRSHHNSGNNNKILSDSDSSDSRGDSSSPIPYNILIRSPPPVIKHQHSPMSRDNSLSPVPSHLFSGRSEYTRAQIENDAAEILALHNHVLRQPSSSSYSSSQASHISRMSADDSPRLRGSEDDFQQDKDVAQGRKIRLAPLKGPVPRQLSPSQLLNKHLDNVRQEEARENRPPTPPAPTPNMQKPQTSTTALQNSPKLTKRKKKRKNTSGGELTTNTGNNSSKSSSGSKTNSTNTNSLTVDGGKKNNEGNSDRVSSSSSGSSMANSPRVSTPLEQRKAIDKSIRSLLQ